MNGILQGRPATASFIPCFGPWKLSIELGGQKWEVEVAQILNRYLNIF
jgi:hypothetical protein